MYEKAVEKLTTEMAANEKHPYVQMIGQYLLAHLEKHPEHAEKILAEGKTILKSLDAMRRYAETKCVGNMAVISDADGYGIVLQYFECWDGEPFDIPPEPQPPARPAVPNRTAPTARNTKPAARVKTSAKSAASDVTQLSLFGDAEGGEWQ
ncbi:Cas9 inhibitor AcrIIA9 family protein [Alicyclobacillus shizuokensis]|uniref:Cas9 inhibitor AcrIIA9 family protein n=1 Tax=Alicyclobacillus shizuokensis TaxID=392014 RepID=UPI000829CB2E|nr:Cas9 inhibitor AcrIIA9 family protein [Alicyclobacillus shizuokensis]